MERKSETERERKRKRERERERGREECRDKFLRNRRRWRTL